MSPETGAAGAVPAGAVRAEHIWKRFRPDRQRRRLADRLQVARRFLAGHRRPWTWALRDVGFTLEPGESLGLVGTNGSGKSTLLKILTRVMYPHSGRVRVGGRVGALIEVAAGIHPELTGRENTYLYGTLLGLTRADVSRRFDDIVAFAELERAVDRQVKYYSSGMKMRLGFAVAAYLEPDVLLVDEVLSVGDASFQQRCLDRMREVLAAGTTLIYVSHDLPTVEATCRQGLWLHQGVLQAHGPVREVLDRYRRAVEQRIEGTGDHDGPVRLAAIECSGPDGGYVQSNEPVRVSMHLEAQTAASATLHLGICETPGHPILLLRRDLRLPAGATKLECTVESLPLPRGTYSVWMSVSGHREFDGAGRRARATDLLRWGPVAGLVVAGPELEPAPVGVVRAAPVLARAHWDQQ
jgi:ABC-2 type transport system ATP-binding protein